MSAACPNASARVPVERLTSSMCNHDSLQGCCLPHSTCGHCLNGQHEAQLMLPQQVCRAHRFCCPARFPNKEETNILIACSDGKAYSMDALVALDEAGYTNLAGRIPAGQLLPGP